MTQAAGTPPFDKEAFVEELIQLQIKHKVVLEGYDLELWTDARCIEVSKKHNIPAVLVTEESIRDYWRKARIN